MADCITPGMIREEDLAAYVLDPSGDDTIAQHIAQCSACAALVAEMRALTTHVGKRLARFDCPTTDEIDAYLADELATARRAAVEHHLQLCSRCAAEVTSSQSFLAQADPLLTWHAPTPPSPFRRLIATLQAATGSAAAPAMALRGTAPQANSPQIYTIEDVAIALRYHGEPAARGAQLQLQGIISVAGAPDVMMAALPVKLLTVPADGATPLIFAETSAEMGFFEFAPVPAGTYQMEITLPDRIVLIEILTL